MQPIVIIGIGELGGVFAKAFLRAGYPVYPVTRSMDILEEANALPTPEVVLVAVAEKDFVEVMAVIPDQWRCHLALLQNELLPRAWEAHKIVDPTVISVWFEKKKGMDYKVLIPSKVYGPQSELIANSLSGIDISCNILSSDDELIYELVLKNVFVFTINIAGLALEEGATSGVLWGEHSELAREVADEVISVQEWLTGMTFQRKRLIDGFIEGINGDPGHKCKGRSAAGRLARMIGIADEAGLDLHRIREIQSQVQR